jgi:hypothetical protein
MTVSHASPPLTPAAQLRPAEEQVIMAYARGYSIAACARLAGLSYTGARGVLLRYGVPRRPPGRTRSVPARAEQQVITAYASGLSIKGSASRAGLTASMARRVLVRHHVPLRAPSSPYQPRPPPA